MGRNGDRDQRVSGRAAAFAGRTLSAQANLLPILHARRNADFQLTAVGDDHTPNAAKRGFLKANRGLKLNVHASAGLITALAATRTKAAEDIRENVFRVRSFRAASAPLVFESLRTGFATRARAKTFKTSAGMEALIEAFGLAGGIDFASVELRAFFLIADHLIGSADLLEFFHRLGIVGVGIRMMLLGQGAEGLFDLSLARLARNAQHLIWITHSCSLRQSYIGIV